MTVKHIRTVLKEITIEPVECGACGTVFGLGSAFMTMRLNDHQQFYCPNGHHISWSGPSEAERQRDRARLERDAARSLAERESRRRQLAEQTAENERRSAAAYKGHATRIRNRIKNGVCPVAGCHRHFTNVRRHMATQHPDYTIPEPTE